MKVQILPSKAYGEITVPPSKSISHRAIICAALSHGISHVYPIYESDDILTTINCLKAIGINFSDSYITGASPNDFINTEILNCNESASTLRFLIPLALINGKEFVFTGTDTLFSRSLKEYEILCKNHNLLFSQKGNRLTVKGPLKPGTYMFSDNISSQFITGMLFALPLLNDDSKLIIPENQVSKPYISLTISVLSEFGISIIQDKNTFLVKGNQNYLSRNFKIEGDYSNAAFFKALNFLGGKIKINGLNEYSIQGDRIFTDLLTELDFGNIGIKQSNDTESYITKLNNYDFNNIEHNNCEFNSVKHNNSELNISIQRNIEIPEISLKNTPDLAPILFAVSMIRNGAVFTDTERLELKESNRICAMKLELKKFGCNIIEENKNIYVPKCSLRVPNEELFGHNDHRIVMALSIILTLTGGIISGAEAVNKSYPTFFDDLKNLGIQVQIISRN